MKIVLVALLLVGGCAGNTDSFRAIDTFTFNGQRLQEPYKGREVEVMVQRGAKVVVHGSSRQVESFVKSHD